MTAAQRAQLETMAPRPGVSGGREWWPYGASEWRMARRMREAGLIRRALRGGYHITDAGMTELLPREDRA